MASPLQLSRRMRPAQLPTWQVQRVQEAIEAHSAQQVERFEAMARIRQGEMLQIAGDYAARSALGMAYSYQWERDRARGKMYMVVAASLGVMWMALIVAVAGR